MSTLKSRGRRLGISKHQALALLESRASVASAMTEPEAYALGKRPKTLELAAKLRHDRRQALEGVLAGDAKTIHEPELSLLVELDDTLMRADHRRVLRAASLALAISMERNRRKYIGTFAAVCRVNAQHLDAYIAALANEIRYRKETGLSPLERLPVLAGYAALADAAEGGQQR